MLSVIERPVVEPTAQVARVDQRDPDPNLARGLDQRLSELVAVPVQVMELADGRDAGFQHLLKYSARVFGVIGTVPLGPPVHLLPPGPEIARSGFHLTTQRVLKGVAVDIRETGDRPPGEDHRVRGTRGARSDRFDRSGFDLDQDVLGGESEPRLLSVPEAGAVQSRIGMRTPRSRATSTARS